MTLTSYITLIIVNGRTTRCHGINQIRDLNQKVLKFLAFLSNNSLPIYIYTSVDVYIYIYIYTHIYIYIHIYISTVPGHCSW